MSAAHDPADFDRALIAAAFSLAAERGWRSVGVAAAARAAGLDLAAARARFPNKGAILMRFGVLADQAALTDLPPADDPAPIHERLFDMLMRRIDVLQAHRPGMLALLRGLPTDPASALLLGLATRRSMRWLLEGAGVSARGLTGEWRMRGLLAVWLWTVRAWRSDESEDLSATMAALDQALRRAGQAAEWLDGLCAARGRKKIDPPASTSAEDVSFNDPPASAESP
ncbi:MAG: TetR family transcriptional regulator [Rhodospirillales bacterium]|nr:TetR family transcriptional regulator [Rhodospirillales bacterium]